MNININNKLAFIQNRCQICLYEKYKTLENMQDFSWRSISKINFYTNETPICSICFDHPILPRMDRCGHVFCLTCILNFLEVTKSEQVLCPMCKDNEIDDNSIKRVNFVKCNELKVGEKVKFTLMVKGGENVCPRFADKLSNYRDYIIPRNQNSISRFLGVIVERDFNVFEDMKLDMIALRKQKPKLNNKTFEHAMLHLRSEMEHFKNEIKIISREESEELIADCEEKFNLKEYEKMKARFKLFYQCGMQHNVYMEEEIQEEIFRDACQRGEVIPVHIVGEIVAVRTVVVDNQFLRKSRMKHLFQGAKITFLTIDRDKYTSVAISGFNLKELASHQEILWKAERDEEEFRQAVARRAAERRHLRASSRLPPFSPIVNNNNDSVRSHRKFHKIDEGFNTCTLGIECLVPDDDYPHAENCIHYSIDKINSSMSRENDSDEKYFGLLKYKLNVFRGDEETSVAHLEDSSKRNDKEERNTNYPPEIIPVSEFDSLVKSNIMMAYIVPKKPKSQLRQKQMRKMKMSNSKTSS